jgi:outer membrane protein assembly factor BamB
VCGCDKKVPLPGKRENISGVAVGDSSLRTDSNLANEHVAVSQAFVSVEHVDVNGNKQHVAKNHKMPQDLRVIWKTSIGGGPINSNIIAFGGKVYAIDARGTLVCVDQKTGLVDWQKVLTIQPDDGIFSGGMTANNGVIYVGTNLGTVIAIDSKTRKELWTKKLKLPIKGSPLFSFGKVFVTSVDNKTFAIDCDKGDVIWSKELITEQTQMTGSGSPAVFGNDIICGYSSGDVASLSSNDGFDKWTDVLFSANISDSGSSISHITASPVVYGDLVLVATSECKMTLIDAKSGARIWEKDIGTVSTPAVHCGWAFVLTSGGAVACVSMRNGGVRWAYDASSYCGKKTSKFSVNQLFGPILINGSVVLFGQSGEIAYIDPSSGALKKFDKLEKVYVNSAPIVVNEKIFAISRSGELCCVG